MGAVSMGSAGAAAAIVELLALDELLALAMGAKVNALRVPVHRAFGIAWAMDIHTADQTLKATILEDIQADQPCT